MASIFDRLRNLFRRRKPLPPRVRGAHRGIAMGSRQQPDLEKYQERLERGHEAVGDDEATAFVYNGEPLFVNSSNVGMVQYHIDDNKLMVEFLGGAAYLYSNVSVEEAISFAQAQSKGSWVWDTLRVRGSKTAHRKPYIRVR